MRLNIRTLKDYSYYSIIKDYTDINGKRTTKIYEKLGNQEQVEARFGKVDTISKIKEYINELNNEDKEELERQANEKFSGTSNAMRIMLSFNEGKENATTIETPKVEDFGERYRALAQSVRQQQFTAFRANPNLFGIPTENLGFSQEEYEAAFRLFNRTVVRPFQRLICDAYDRIYGETGVLTITPFSLEETATEKQVN